MPTSRETSSNAALSGGNNRATALSLNACPYRANVFSRRPLFVEKTGLRNQGKSRRGAKLWICGRCASRTGRLAVDNAARCPPRRPSPTSPTTSHHYVSLGTSDTRSKKTTTILTRGAVDHTTVHRWAVKMLPVLALMLRRRKRPVGLSWRMDETYVKVAGQWKYLYRAVDKAGQTIDFLLRAHRDYAAARCFFERAIDLHGVPGKITIDKSGANTAAIQGMRADSGADIEMRQSKYLNNLIEQDHRAVKRLTRPMLGFKNFRFARALIAGIETMHMIKKGQLDAFKDRASSSADQFYSLAF